MITFKPIDTLKRRRMLRKISGSQSSLTTERYCNELFQLAQQWNQRYKEPFSRKLDGRILHRLVEGKLDSFHRLILAITWNNTYEGFFPEDVVNQITAALVKETVIFPRSLLTCKDQEAFKAPVRGIGSPNGVHITVYKVPGVPHPVQLSFAGCTGDQELNSRIFSSLYALAISSDSEPTLITTNGGTVSVLPLPGREESGNLLKFALGPTGPVEPTRGIPSLGMETGEAMILVGDFLRESQGLTGLVQVHEWHYSNLYSFEAEIRQAFAMAGHERHQFRNPEYPQSNTGVITTLPVLYKYSGTDIRPVSIDIPYTLINLKKFTKQVNMVRQEHMKLLYDACQKRISYAKESLQSETIQYECWKQLVVDGKDAEFCRSSPVVYISGEYNFELGVTVVVDPPREIERRDFEENHRPLNIKAAEESVERYEALHTKLKAIDTENGKAGILTTKYLVDSIIRRAPLLTRDNMIRQHYERLLKTASILLWTPIIARAKELGFDPAILAADNVVFNTSIKNECMVIEPYYLVDINNFIAECGGDHAIIKIAPSNREPALHETLIPDPANEITSLTALHTAFNRWMDTTYNFRLDTHNEINSLAESTGVFEQPALHTEIWIEYGKQCLLSQNKDKAARLFEEVLRYDFASVFYWNALFNQYLYFDQMRIFNQNLTPFDKLSNTERFLVNKLKIMNNRIDELRRRIQSGRATEEEESEYALLSSTEPVPLSRKVSDFLEQLASKDLELSQQLHFSYIRQLTAGQKSGTLLEQELNLSPEDVKKRSNFFSAIAAVELLNLAVYISNVAQNIDFSIKSPIEVRQILKKIIEEINNLVFSQPLCVKEFVTLYEQFERATGGVDIMGISLLKSKLHALSELIADESIQRALQAAEEYPSDPYNVVIPGIILTHWKRAYATVLEYVLKVRGNHTVKLGDFNPVDLSANYSLTHGLITAEDNGNAVVLKLNRQPVAEIHNLTAENKVLVLGFFRFGIRLGLPQTAGATVFDRIKGMEIVSAQNALAESFYRNREALAVLMARKGFASIRQSNLTDPHSDDSTQQDVYGLEDGFVDLGNLTSSVIMNTDPRHTTYFEAKMPFRLF